MKTNLFTSVLFTMLLANVTFGQDLTTVTASNYDISDNLDLTAVASIFGESKDLADFEYRINNPKTQISNLDLNRDGKVDYLRVIESVEKSTHLIIIQSVLGKDLYQDVATIEVEKDTRNNSLQVQVVGDVFLYGNNYIYEPVYYVRPIIFNTFWTRNYIVYHSPWYWGYYPGYYSYWAPYPIFRYRSNVCNYVNVNNYYYYSDVRHSPRAVAMHNRTRSNYYERQHPNQSFTRRNDGYTNSYALNQTRATAVTNTTRANVVNRNNSTRGNASVTTNTTRGTSVTVNSSGTTRGTAVQSGNTSTRNSGVSATSNTTRSTSSVNANTTTRSSSNAMSNTTRSSSIENTSSSRNTPTVRSNPNTSRGSSVGASSSSSRGSTSMSNSSNRGASSGRTTR